MPRRLMKLRDLSKPLAALILFQGLCALYFVLDVLRDGRDGESPLLHIGPELAATMGLVIAIAVQIRVLLDLLRRQQRMEQGLGVAAGALGELMEEYFRAWSLTPSEQDVAAFTIKGYSIAEIATLRGSAEATVKTHLNSIYRKANVPGRAQLVSVLVEDLLRAPLMDGADVHGTRPVALAEADDGDGADNAQKYETSP
jgi:DNA-binding CsgD family transcriptional regulator